MKIKAAVVRKEGLPFVQGDAIPQILIPQIIELYLQGRFPIDRLIKYYALEEINKAATDSEQGKVIKAVLRPNRT
jgi:aryl-alcohol dehydrogenase